LLPGQVIRSPRARGYRTTSKRKAFLHGSTLYLLLGDKAALPKNRQYFTASPLEPKEHEIIYRFLQQKLSEPAFRLIAGHLNYLIIRGGYTEQAVIFNVDLLNGPLVRKLKLLSAHLQKLPIAVTAAFVYLDPSQSDYYLESKRPAETLNFKKLFGPDQLMATYHDCRYQFHPTSFSQINESMVETMLTRRGNCWPRPRTSPSSTCTAATACSAITSPPITGRSWPLTAKALPSGPPRPTAV